MTFARKRGDTYPIEAEITLNNSVFDLTGSTVDFSFKDSEGAVVTIAGVIDEPLTGKVRFTPTTEFDTAGVYTYDIQRTTGSTIATHLSGTMHLEDDVTP